MTRAAIVTIVSMNQGNRLQNYALQTVLGRYFDEVETLLRDRPRGVARQVARKLRPFVKHDKVNLYRSFDVQHVTFSRYRLVCGEAPDERMADSYDAFVIGSDQVWNPTFWFNSELEYVPFAPKDKKIAYAASFGVSEIVEARDRTAELLGDIAHVSVREDAGARIVRDLTGRLAPVVCDPALLLTPEEWVRIEKKPNVAGLPRRFCLKYVLGDDAYSAAVEALAQKARLSVVDLGDDRVPVGPAEFVWLVRHAGLVCTDSFHATLFSIVFDRPFAVFERRSAEKDMSSRFQTLERVFGLRGRCYGAPDFDEERVLGGDAGFGSVGEGAAAASALASWRKSSTRWLEEAARQVGR